MNITYKKAEQEDAEQLQAIQREAFLPLYEKYHDEESPANDPIEEFTGKIGNPYGAYYVILGDGAPVGGIFAHPCNEAGDEMYLCSVYVKPSVQGHGIAQGAISYVESLFPHAKRWILDVPASEPKNIHIYEKAGYRVTDNREYINEQLTIVTYIKEM